MFLSNPEIIARLLTSMVLAGIIGAEREYRGKPAGVRTNVMVGLGATLMTISSIKVIDIFPRITGVDPTRIAAQIITGIGFIGAGAILHKSESHVIGLTTAAVIWVVAGIGMAVGLGLYTEAIVTTGLVFGVFLFMHKFVKAIRYFRGTRHPEAVEDSKNSE